MDKPQVIMSISELLQSGARVFVSLFRRLSIPFHGLDFIFRNSAPFFGHESEIMLRSMVALLRRLPKPPDRLGIVLWDAAPL